MIEVEDISRQFGLHPAAVRVLLRDAYADYGRSQTLDAVARAMDRDARSWKYVSTILDRERPNQGPLPEPAEEPGDRFRFPGVELERYLERHRRIDEARKKQLELDESIRVTESDHLWVDVLSYLESEVPTFRDYWSIHFRGALGRLVDQAVVVVQVLGDDSRYELRRSFGGALGRAIREVYGEVRFVVVS